VGVGPLGGGGIISISKSKWIENLFLFQRKAASRMTEVGVGTLGPLDRGEWDPPTAS